MNEDFSALYTPDTQITHIKFTQESSLLWDSGVHSTKHSIWFTGTSETFEQMDHGISQLTFHQ